MYIKHEITNSIVRFYEVEPQPNTLPSYSAVCSVFWDNPKRVWVYGLHGKLTRGALRELVRLFRGLGVEEICANRSGAHQLPLGVETTLGFHVLSVEKLYLRFVKNSLPPA